MIDSPTWRIAVGYEVQDGGDEIEVFLQTPDGKEWLLNDSQVETLWQQLSEAREPQTCSIREGCTVISEFGADGCAAHMEQVTGQ